MMTMRKAQEGKTMENKCKYSIAINEKDYVVIRDFVDLMRAIHNDCPDNAPYQESVRNTMQELSDLTDYMNMDLQNDEVSTDTLTDMLIDDYNAVLDDEDDDEEEEESEPCTIEIENPQDIPDDVWDKMMEILLHKHQQ